MLKDDADEKNKRNGRQDQRRFDLGIQSRLYRTGHDYLTTGGVSKV